MQRSSVELTVRANVDGAAVLIDDDDVGQTPLAEPLRLPDGRHVVRISKEGYEPAEQTVVLSPGETASVSLALVSTERVEEDEPGMHPLFWIGMSGTIAAGLTSGTFWGLTADYKNRYEDEVDAYDPLAENAQQDYTQLEDRRSKTITFNKVAVGASIATGVFAATMVLGIVLSDGDEDEEAPAEVTAAPGGVQVRF